MGLIGWVPLNITCHVEDKAHSRNEYLSDRCALTKMRINPTEEITFPRNPPGRPQVRDVQSGNATGASGP